MNRIVTEKDIKDMVTPGKQVTFLRYQNGELWYVTQCGFEFPVPVSDTGSAAFEAQDRAMLFMRWINRHIRMLMAARTNTETATQEIS